MLHFRLTVLPALVLALAVPTAASALTIDSFDDPAIALANTGTPNDTDTTASGSFLGTNRVLEANWASGPNDVTGEVDSGGGSLLNISLGANTLGDISLLWQLIGGVDLTELNTKNAIALQIAFDDLPANITLIVTDTGANSGSASTTAPGGIFSPTSQSLLFSSFSGSVNFGSIESIQLIITPNFPAADLQIDFIESAFVPEPGTALLLGAGLAGLALQRRRAA